MKVSESEWAQLERLIADAVGDPSRTEALAEAATILRDHHRVAERARALLGDRQAPRTAAEAPATYARGAQSIREVPQRPLHEVVRMLLQAVQTPMHVRDLTASVRGSGWRSPRGGDASPAKLEAQITSRLVKHPEIFERVAPNTFGLVGWPPPDRRAMLRLGLIDTPRRAGDLWADEIHEHEDAIYEGRS